MLWTAPPISLMAPGPAPRAGRASIRCLCRRGGQEGVPLPLRLRRPVALRREAGADQRDRGPRRSVPPGDCEPRRGPAAVSPARRGRRLGRGELAAAPDRHATAPWLQGLLPCWASFSTSWDIIRLWT